MGGKLIEQKNFDGWGVNALIERGTSPAAAERGVDGSLGRHFGKHARYAKHIWSVSGGGAAVKSDKMFVTRGTQSKWWRKEAMRKTVNAGGEFTQPVFHLLAELYTLTPPSSRQHSSVHILSGRCHRGNLRS